ncbi:MAG TPA: DUF1015 domain-containing protein [Dissulfurispiraceae bacterium]|nr:DUF1015 domain-containing protein [Dissulfurispiraceae bacterium]
MALIIPFRGVLYNAEKIAGNDVVAPPYDVISPAQKDRLYGKSAYNIVRIDFGKDFPEDSADDNKYTRARAAFDEWLEAGILLQDTVPAFYGYEIRYPLLGEKLALRGILGLLKLEELGTGVFPHEETRPKAKADRLNLMYATGSNTSPIFGLYNSPANVSNKIISRITETPYLSAEDPDGAEHRLHKITGAEQMSLIQADLSGKPIFIADGHHRYEVALAFKKEMDLKTGREADDAVPRPWDYVLMFFANIADEGLTILPTHRLVKGIPSPQSVLDKLTPDFEIVGMSESADICSTMRAEGKHSFGLYMRTQKGWNLLRYRGGKLKDVHAALGDLDVVIMHELIINRDLMVSEIAYEMSVMESVARVNSGDFDAAFFLNATGVDDLERVAGAGLRMPAKSTYFYPKLLTGLVINRFGE